MKTTMILGAVFVVAMGAIPFIQEAIEQQEVTDYNEGTDAVWAEHQRTIEGHTR